MATKNWESLKTAYCTRSGVDVTLEAEMIYPAEFLPEQPPRITAHRCSHALECNQETRASCVWAGTNPGYDPFSA